jgi:pyruvate/2-oxoglutarate dehydrogenase complex dihydrolipoamide dehydrogenase (E3) component
VKNFKNFLAEQVKKRDIQVRLGTEATPESLEGEDYDIVVAAIGAAPALPPIKGLTWENAIAAPDVFGAHEKLGQRVAVIGGGEIGVEAGIYLARNGHDVTVLEMRGLLAPDATPIHYRSSIENAWEELDNFHGIVNARCKEIDAGVLTYIGSDGNDRRVEADDFVVAAGMKAKTDEALAYYAAGDQFAMVGDCAGVGSVQTAMRSALAVTSAI